ncbi:PREDICTED: probable helicase with zinc finger domain [Amphimedon queenslandica]|uniref:Death domain-containing protein n=1 Tax=Amphimedon queenslandica TaxID=400682 RepID=A0AAN0JRF4_AMPQE|nr:PREDICTED: probable helicase with zinc finger domain [Amphimedon queenslandica]|eukprot:XP_019859428.1 PREDICTED: probable helicase with zinc finger domain [Amphimedon queenslandica]
MLYGPPQFVALPFKVVLCLNKMAVAANPAGTNLSFETDFKDHLDTRELIFDDLRAHQCSDSVLLKLSKKLGNWDTAGLYLKIVADEIKAIKVDNSSEESRRVALLNKWKQKNGDDATYYNLISGLCDADRIDIADQALDCLMKNMIEIKKEQEKARQEQEEREKEERRQQEIQLEYEMKENFLTRMKSKLRLKCLDVPDLQMYLGQEDVNEVAVHISKDWYKFGKIMKVEEGILDHIKEVGKDKLERKRKLLEHLISKEVRFEDIIYGLYDSANEHDPFINGILDYLFRIRIKQPEESPDGQNPKTNKKWSTSSKLEEKQGRSYKKQYPISRPHDQSSAPYLTVFIPVPWQAKFDVRRKKQPTSSQLIPQSHLNDLTPDNYREHFYSALWLEEDEHIKKLSRKCDGVDYKLTIYDPKKVPPFLTQNSFHKYRYGYISGLSDDKIEYATQASDNVTISQPDSSTRLCIAFKHHYNFNHLENRMYIVADHPSNSLFEAIKNGTEVKDGSEIRISAEFTVKYSYFDHLHHAVVKASEHVLKCLLPDVFSFVDPFLRFQPQHSDFRYMKLDKKHQLEALEMIAFESPSIGKPPPPVILYGPFGTGKTRILARAAYEVMMNGVNKNKCTRILISAHHEISITTFITAYFGVIEKKIRPLPFKVILITKQKNYGVYADMYMTPDEFSKKSADISTMPHVIIIATYTTSLKLHQYLCSPEGFFTHLFLDEAAQVREPEAITPLALATKDAKIVLAGDTQQVGPNILVLGEEAKKFGLNVSLLQRLLGKYEEIGSGATRYVTKLSVNYRSHNSLIELPNLFYENLEINPDKEFQKCSGPTGYRFVSANSRLVEHYDDPDQQGVEARIVLEQVRKYLDKMKQINPKFNPRHDVCIITSTRKQLNRIRSMAFDYDKYETVRKVSFKPSFMIQGHEFQAIFLSLFELVGDDEMNASYIKSLFNPYVFNTVITRAKFHVVAIGSPEEVKQFELDTLSHPDRGGNTTKCWHEYLKLCEKQRTISNERKSAEKPMRSVSNNVHIDESSKKDAVPEAETKVQCKLENVLQDGDRSQKSDIHVDLIRPEEPIATVASRQLSSMSSIDGQLKEIETKQMELLREENALLREKIKSLEEELEKEKRKNYKNKDNKK